MMTHKNMLYTIFTAWSTARSQWSGRRSLPNSKLLRETPCHSSRLFLVGYRGRLKRLWTLVNMYSFGVFSVTNTFTARALADCEFQIARAPEIGHDPRRRPIQLSDIHLARRVGTICNALHNARPRQLVYIKACFYGMDISPQVSPPYVHCFRVP